MINSEYRCSRNVNKRIIFLEEETCCNCHKQDSKRDSKIDGSAPLSYAIDDYLLRFLCLKDSPSFSFYLPVFRDR